MNTIIEHLRFLERYFPNEDILAAQQNQEETILVLVAVEKNIKNVV